MLETMRRFARLAAGILLSGFLLAIIAGVAGEFFIEAARENDWYQDASGKLEAALTAFTAFVTSTWFLVATAMLGGLTIGLWWDWFARRLEAREAGAENVDLDDLTSHIERARDLLFRGGYTVEYEAFHEASALAYKLTRLRFVTPLHPSNPELTNFENFNTVMYRYLSVILPYIRDKSLDDAKHFGKIFIEMEQQAMRKAQDEREKRLSRRRKKPKPEVSQES